MIQTFIKFFLVLGKVSDPRHIDRNNADGACAFAGSEEPARLLSQFPQIQTETAAHAAHIAGLHIAVDIIGEIRRSVLGCHFKEKAVIFCVGPVKVPGDGIGRDRILEAAAVGVALDHRFDERLIDHIHLFLAVFVLKVHLFAAHDGVHLRHIVRHGPVQGNVGKRRLRAPAARRIDAVYKGFDALFHFRVGQVVRLHKRCKVCIKRRKRLSSRPLVLHNTEEIHHLVAEHGKMLCRRGRDLSWDAAQPL